MNPLMDALKLAGDPGRASATPGVDFSAGHRFFVHPSSHERSDAGESAPAALGAFDPRSLRRGPGVARIAGIALSLLAVIAAAAGGGYFVWKTEFVRPALVGRLTPHAVPVVDLTPVHAANAAMNEAGEPAASAALRSDPPARPPTSQAPATAQEAMSTALPGAGTPQRAERNATGGPRVSAGATVGAADIPAPEPGPGGAEHRRDAGAGIVIRKRTRPDRVAVSLERAYRAFLSGDGGSAAQAYRVVLGHEPGNRNAHLGLAALAARAGRWNEAAGHYARVLESHPADTVARAALVAIDERDPAQRESRLKALLASEPNAAHLHFDLGSLYAAQRRWPEARRSFSDAYRFDRSNADYAHNLAVSLDHLSRPEGALGLYREALLLSRNRASGIDTVAVLQRIRALELHAGTGLESARPAVDAAVAAPAVRIR